MDISVFHKRLLGQDPTPEQQRLYDIFPKRRGFSNEEQDPDLFVATFIVSLADTWDAATKTSKYTVPLAIPRAIEPWCIDQMDVLVNRVRLRLNVLPKAFVASFAQAARHVETGTRVFAIVEAPKRWTAFGFSVSSVAPPWLKEGLLV